MADGHGGLAGGGRDGEGVQTEAARADRDGGPVFAGTWCGEVWVFSLFVWGGGRGY